MDPNIQPPVQPVQPQPVDQPVNVPPQTKSSSKLLVIIGVLAVLLLTLGSGYYVLQSQTQKPTPSPTLVSTVSPSPAPTTDPTANWKTYKNSKYGFEVQYPTDWYAKEYQDFFLLFGKSPEPKELFPLIHPWPDLYIATSTTLLTEQELNKSNIEQGATIEGQSLNQRKYTVTTFAGVKANQRVGLSSGLVDSNQITQISFNHNNYGWTISYPNTDYKGNHLAIYDQILSTFKFTDQNDLSSVTQETNGFPIFPNAEFINKNVEAPCQGETSGFTTCNSTTYTWETPDDGDKVQSWFNDTTKHPEWICKGGAGSYESARSFSVQTTCRKATLAYGLSLEATLDKTTIKLVIRNK